MPPRLRINNHGNTTFFNAPRQGLDLEDEPHLRDLTQAFNSPLPHSRTAFQGRVHSPSAEHVDSNSQAHNGRGEAQLERDSGLPAQPDPPCPKSRELSLLCRRARLSGRERVRLSRRGTSWSGEPRKTRG